VTATISDLVDRFNQHRDAYRAGTYNETQARRDFIDPLFECLGWDVSNTAGLSEAYRDVIQEYSLRAPGGTTAPDYLFRLQTAPQFFVEAKKPSVNLRDSATAALQVRRYAWSAKLPISILTDFEEFVVYDCRFEPKAADSAAVARLLYVTVDDYAAKWDQLVALFGREAVSAGSLRSYASALPAHRGTREVDEAFLTDIDSWRAHLAGTLRKSNPSLTARQLNFAVQQTIDRIVFLRICEDRSIEPYGQLRDLADGDDIYKRLAAVFRGADQRYNSGLFHFEVEQDRPEAPDSLTLELQIDDDVLRRILRRLYYPESPYAFNVVPPSVLGQVYEQFLGKTIHISRAGRATIEEKPELKKAGGVYYTPSYVVDYIVAHEIGPRLDRATPKTLSPATGSRLRILDPACGSGSFLIGAYEHLLRWYEQWYVGHDPQRWARGKSPRLRQIAPDTWQLTTAERKRILLDHIFGVDVDPQAVEVTKLSLLLKVLEHESDASLSEQLQLFHARALPDLSKNIKCGNSLIGPDFYGTQLALGLDDDGLATINPFNWASEFPDVVPAPGFDVVIGNPPYRRELSYKTLMDQIAATPFGARYRAARMDLWYYFVHRGLELLSPDGALGFIVNAYWTAGTGAKHLIASLRDEAQIDELFLLGKRRVFSNVSGQHMIMRISRSQGATPTTVRLPGDADSDEAEPYVVGHAPTVAFTKSAAQLFRGDAIDLEVPADELLALLDNCESLDAFGRVRQGIAENPASINPKTNGRFGDRWKAGEGVFALTPREIDKLRLSDQDKSLLRDYWDLVDIGRFWIADPPSLKLIYATRQNCPDIDLYPGIKAHLARFRPIMDARRETVNGSNRWWQLHWPRDEEIWRSTKVLSVQMAARPTFAADEHGAFVPFSVNVFVPNPDQNEHVYYWTALLNSRLLWKWFQHHAKRRGVGLEINGNVLRRSPIVGVDFRNPADGARHDAIVERTREAMLAANERMSADTAHASEIWSRRLEAAQGAIDDLVYEIYGLDGESIALVRASTAV
jgi:hypothetical protein